MRPRAARMILVHDGLSHCWIPTYLLDPELAGESDELLDSPHVSTESTDIITCSHCGGQLELTYAEE